MSAVWGQVMVRQAGDNMPSTGGPQCLLSTVIYTNALFKQR